MHPFLVQYGFLQIRIYGLAIATGVLVATYLVYLQARRRGYPWAEATFELGFWAVVGGIAGARTWEILFTWDFYRAEPWKVLAIWEGGISIQGALLGGALAFVLWARRNKVNVWKLVDMGAAPVALAQGIGRIGCLFNGDAFGKPIADTALPSWLGVTYAPESPAYMVYGNTPLVPAEAFEGLADFAIAAFLVLYRPRQAVTGWRVLTWGMLYSAARFGLEFWRTDSLMAGPIKAAQLLAVATFLVCGAVLAYRARRVPPEPEDAPVAPGGEKAVQPGANG